MIVNIFIGVTVSILMVNLNLAIPFTPSILLVIATSLIASWINPKYSCLAYNVPIVYLIDCILHFTGVITDETIQLIPYENFIILIGILHAIEGFLTTQYGANDNKEIISYNKTKIVGGYRLDKKWYVPLLFFTIKDFYVPIVAIIAYTDETYTMAPTQKAAKMGFVIKVYACIILCLGILTKIGYISLTLMLFFTLILHELMFAINDQLEIHSPINTPPFQGIRIIATTQSQDFHNPFTRGDIIKFINDYPINSVGDYKNVLNMEVDQYIVRIQTLEGKEQVISCNKTLLERVNNVFLLH